jgi:phenylalanyl-tRNA synthetase beta chain
MKLSLNWIKKYLDLPADLSVEKLAYDLTMSTVEVESVVDLAASLDKVVVGQLIDVQPHPQADLLRLVQVDIGSGTPSKIVCGGSNLEIGQWVAVAVPGSYVRWHGEGEPVEIKTTKLRGQISEGMVCAAEELDLEELFPAPDPDAVIDLAGFETYPGQPLAELLQRNDIVLEIDNKSITNRPDLWGHYGVARELAAIYQLPLKPLPVFNEEVGPGIPVQIEDEQRCRRYIALGIDGLSNTASPYWLRNALAIVGVRPINLIVDVTNYVMLAVGQPTHGFDAEHIHGGIIVRMAKKDEKLELLNGELLDLRPSDQVIADERSPLALAGVMGGKRDSILPETTHVILEIANFDALGTRRTATHFGLRTEASSRNEKGLDTQRVDQALGLSAALFKELVPGVSFTGLTDLELVPTAPLSVQVDKAYLDTRLGKELPVSEIEAILQRLGFVTQYRNGLLDCQVPSWRATGDVDSKADILEEVARIYGYENFAFQAPKLRLDGALNQPHVQMAGRIAAILADRGGMQEVFTYPWVDERYLKASGEDLDKLLRLATPPSPAQAHLRSSLLPGLLEAAVINLRYRQTFKLFEQGRVFPSLEQEPTHLGLIIAGHKPEALLREIKGLLEALPRLAQFEELHFEARQAPAWAEEALWMNIIAQDSVIGSYGLVSARALRLAGIKRITLVAAELNQDALTPLPSRENRYQALPTYPETEKDLSVILDDAVSWEQVEALVKPMVRRLAFVTEFRGGSIPEGKRSLSLRFWFGADDHTLNAHEIEKMLARIRGRLEHQLGGVVPTGK